MKLTVEKLSDVLFDNGFIKKKFYREKEIDEDYGFYPVVGAGAEVFGKQAYVFVNMGTVENRKAAENFLKELGIKASADYAPGTAISEIPVRYFKGWHWDE